jgi:DNA-directed RNA polymerase subunit H (RpoH/RPB5)
MYIIIDWLISNMSSNTSSRIISIYKSRKTILELLDALQYSVSDYNGFSINEIDAMFNNSQLDMLVSHKTDKKGVYVKYYISPKQTIRQIRPSNLDDIIEDLYTIETVLTKKDTLIIIIDDEPNETILNKIKYLYDHEGVFVIIHNIKRLQFNILNHSLVPKTVILSDEEHKRFIEEYNIQNTQQIPEISRFDPHSMALCMRPGQVCCIFRESVTALTHKYYRICI